MGPKPKDDGPPDDDDDDGSDEDKRKKDKKSKKDKKRRKKKKRRSSSSSSSSDSSQVGKQMLKAIMKQLKKGSKKDKRSDDEGTDGEKPKNKAKEAEKITFPKFPLPEQYRSWRIRVREAVVAASDKPDMAFEWLSKVWAKESTEEQLRDPEGFVTLDAKVLSAITNVLEGEFARQTDTFKEREANAGRPVRGRQVLFRLNDHFATNALHGSVYDLEDLLAITLANENLVVFLSNWQTVLSGIQKAPDETFLEPLFHRQVKKCKALQHDINIYERAAKRPTNSSTMQLGTISTANDLKETGKESQSKQQGCRQLLPRSVFPKVSALLSCGMAPATKGNHVNTSTRYPSSAVVATHPMAEEDAHREVEPIVVPNQESKNVNSSRLESVTEVTNVDSSTKASQVCQLRPAQSLEGVAEAGKIKSRERRRRIVQSPSQALEAPVVPVVPSRARDQRGQRAQARVRKPLFQLQFVF